jgi:hypothetical protein
LLLARTIDHLNTSCVDLSQAVYLQGTQRLEFRALRDIAAELAI